MLPNCEHEDCCDCLELAEVCSGIRFNHMVMMAQVAKMKRGGYWSKCLSCSWSTSGSRFRSSFRSGSRSVSRSLSKFLEY